MLLRGMGATRRMGEMRAARAALAELAIVDVDVSFVAADAAEGEACLDPSGAGEAERARFVVVVVVVWMCAKLEKEKEPGIALAVVGCFCS